MTDGFRDQLITLDPDRRRALEEQFAQLRASLEPAHTEERKPKGVDVVDATPEHPQPPLSKMVAQALQRAMFDAQHDDVDRLWMKTETGKPDPFLDERAYDDTGAYRPPDEGRIDHAAGLVLYQDTILKQYGDHADRHLQAEYQPEILQRWASGDAAFEPAYRRLRFPGWRPEHFQRLLTAVERKRQERAAASEAAKKRGQGLRGRIRRWLGQSPPQ